jgi:transcriptional antiterminator NusG
MLVQRKLDADAAAPDAREIRQALVPTEQVVEIKNGKKVTVERKVFPGYVLVEMVMGEETLHTINAIQGVIKFVGKDRDPQPLRDEEVKRLLGIAVEEEVAEPKEEIPFLVGQAVAITDGPFTDFNGTIEDVMVDKGKVRVSVSLFGRPTSVELDYLQLKGH